MDTYLSCGLALVIALTGQAWGATFTVAIEATSSMTVVPGGSVSYRITGAVSNDDNLGLAGFAVDVETDTGVGQPQAVQGPTLGSFVRNAGFGNPAGFGGTVDGDDLRQVGGAQNTIGNDGVPPNPSYPSGVVNRGIAQGPSAAVLAEGTVTAPSAPGQYTVRLVNAFGRVLVSPAGNRYTVDAATASVGNPLTITVRVTADLDMDGDVDGFDFLTFANCYNGADRRPLPACQSPTADIEGDGDVDGFDFLTFANCYNGADRPPLCR